MINKKKIIIGLGVIIISLISSISYYKFYYLKYVAPYRFWNDFLAKDKKPLFVSLKEYQDKNEQGFCWRDKRFYSKEELKEKAMKSLLKRLSYGMNIYRTGRELNTNSQLQFENKSRCRHKKDSNKYCYILAINGEMTNQEFIDLITDIPSNDYNEVLKNSRYWKIFNERIIENNMNLEAPQKWQTYSNESDVDKNIVDIKKNTILVEKRLYDHNHFYGSDCCNVIDRNEFNQLNNYRLSGDSFIFYSHIIKSKSLNPFNDWHDIIISDVHKNELNPKYGNSNFYLKVNYVHQISLNKPNAHIRNEMFVMNNCGDILYSPSF